MKKITLIMILAFFQLSLLNAQNVSINDNGAAPNSHAILDVDISSNDAGILIPRLTTTQRNNMTLGTTDEGLTVYDETLKAFVFWTGTKWGELTTQGANWSVTGNSAINSTSNFIGTVDANDFVFRTNNIERARILSTGQTGINTTTPDVYFHIFGDDGITATDDATYSSGTGLMVLGNLSSRNLVLDQNEILARNNGAASSLYLQNRGGDIKVHYDKDNINHDDGIVIIKDDGKMGIGLLAPEDMLHIYSALPYIRFTDIDGGNTWNAGVYGDAGFQRFQITEFTGGGSFRQRLVIKEGGNVGIGTVSPEGMLHIKADNTNSATFIIDADAGDDANDTWKLRSDATSHSLDFYNDVNNRVSFTSGGNVGIGTTTPEGRLHVSASEGNNATFILDADEGDDATDTWKIRSVAANNNLNILNDATTLMSIENLGNVGIGTDNPDAKLHILTSGTVMGQYPGTVAAFQQNGATGDWARISIIGGNAGASLIDFGDADLQNTGTLKFDHTDNFLSYNYYDGTTETEILRIEDYGYVGIGKTNPSEKLDVDGAVLLGTTINSNAGAIRWNGSNFQGYDGSSWVALDVQAAGGAGGWTDGGTDVYLTTNSDNVGIGTSSPNEKLEVNGSIRMTDGNEGTNKVMVSDVNGTASWSNENDGVKTRVIRKINQGASEFTVWSHPEGIDITYNPVNRRVYFRNNTGDATDDWAVVIEGDARKISATVGADQYIKNLRHDGEVLYLDLDVTENINSGWFRIIASDLLDEEDGFVLQVVFYNDDFNGTVQYWDN